MTSSGETIQRTRPSGMRLGGAGSTNRGPWRTTSRLLSSSAAAGRRAAPGTSSGRRRRPRPGRALARGRPRRRACRGAEVPAAQTPPAPPARRTAAGGEQDLYGRRRHQASTRAGSAFAACSQVERAGGSRVGQPGRPQRTRPSNQRPASRPTVRGIPQRGPAQRNPGRTVRLQSTAWLDNPRVGADAISAVGTVSSKTRVVASGRTPIATCKKTTSIGRQERTRCAIGANGCAPRCARPRR